MATLDFVLTKEWLFQYYGSKYPGQVEQSRKWLLTHGKNVTEEQADDWKDWKHLIEYQPNTEDIVPQCLAKIGHRFFTELAAHAWVNYLRVPAHANSYRVALERWKPKTILELGTGGDSAISTSQFLRHIESMGEGELLSIDLNPLGVTWERYKDVPFWNFIQADSIDILNQQVALKKKWDMVFLDSLPFYQHVLKELDRACLITDHLLLDDITMEALEHDKEGGKNRAVLEWVPAHPEWERIDYQNIRGNQPCVGSLIKGGKNV
jgi:predicted O-methyltransferase YrrM